MRRLSVLMLLSGIFAGTVYGADIESVTVAHDSYLESINFSNYIAPKKYAPVMLSDGYGQLLSESQVGIYKPAALQDFYKQEVCKGLWGRNCKFTINSIEKYTGINLDNESSLVGLPYSLIDAYKVSYTTPDMNNNTHPVSGAVLIPETNQPLKGVVIFYHFTVLNKSNVPSNFSGDEFHTSKMLAATLANAGYVVVMPDYLGEGIDRDKVHPYMLYPQINALSGIYMLKLLPQIQPLLRYQLQNNQIPLFLTGYSEGAGYALWADKILEENPRFLANYGFKLTKTVPIEGAYNLSNVTLPFLMSDTLTPQVAPYYIQDKRVSAFAKPGLVANVLNSYAYFDLNQDESAVFSTKFNSCSDCELDGEKYTVSGLLQSPAKELSKYKMLYNAAKSAGYNNDNDSLVPLTNQQLLISSAFKDTVAHADIYNWRATTPISFLTFEYDSVVPRLNTETAFAAMSDKGSTSLQITVVPNQNFKVDSYVPFSDDNVDHASGMKFLLLFARNQFAESASSGGH